MTRILNDLDSKGRAPCRCRGNRVLSASPTEPLRVSSLRVTPAWRTALRDYRGLIFFLIILPLAIVGGLAVGR